MIPITKSTCWGFQRMGVHGVGKKLQLAEEDNGFSLP